MSAALSKHSQKKKKASPKVVLSSEKYLTASEKLPGESKPVRRKLVSYLLTHLLT